MTLINSLFATRFQHDGSHSPMTLPEYASLFLADIECSFGPRDRSFTIVGIDIDSTPENSPRLWFPNSGIASDDAERRSRHVVIRLSATALTDLARARWQLAHECFHLLDPWHPRVDGQPTNMLEEGLATWYQNSRVPEAEYHDGIYAAAEDLVRPLMDQLPSAVKRIRQERRLRIGRFTPEVLREYCPEVHQDTLQRLCEQFQT